MLDCLEQSVCRQSAPSASVSSQSQQLQLRLDLQHQPLQRSLFFQQQHQQQSYRQQHQQPLPQHLQSFQIGPELLQLANQSTKAPHQQQQQATTHQPQQHNDQPLITTADQQEQPLPAPPPPPLATQLATHQPAAGMASHQHELISYYFGSISRETAEWILRNTANHAHGAYLLRSSGPNDDFVLSLLVLAPAQEAQVLHYKIVETEDSFVALQGQVGDEKFATIDELIDKAQGVATKPRWPVNRKALECQVLPPTFWGLAVDQVRLAIIIKARQWNFPLLGACAAATHVGVAGALPAGVASGQPVAVSQQDNNLNAGGALTGIQVANQSHQQTTPLNNETIRTLIYKSLHEFQPWFHGKVSRDEAERRIELAEPGRDGRFLVRERDNLSYALCISHKKTVKHYRIDILATGELAIQDGKKFTSLMALVSHYTLMNDGLWCALTDACPRPIEPAQRQRPNQAQRQQQQHLNSSSSSGSNAGSFEQAGGGLSLQHQLQSFHQNQKALQQTLGSHQQLQFQHQQHQQQHHNTKQSALQPASDEQRALTCSSNFAQASLRAPIREWLHCINQKWAHLMARSQHQSLNSFLFGAQNPLNNRSSCGHHKHRHGHSRRRAAMRDRQHAQPPAGLAARSQQNGLQARNLGLPVPAPHLCQSCAPAQCRSIVPTQYGTFVGSPLFATQAQLLQQQQQQLPRLVNGSGASAKQNCAASNQSSSSSSGDAAYRRNNNLYYDSFGSEASTQLAADSVRVAHPPHILCGQHAGPAFRYTNGGGGGAFQPLPANCVHFAHRGGDGSRFAPLAANTVGAATGAGSQLHQQTHPGLQRSSDDSSLAAQSLARAVPPSAAMAKFVQFQDGKCLRTYRDTRSLKLAYLSSLRANSNDGGYAQASALRPPQSESRPSVDLMYCGEGEPLAATFKCDPKLIKSSSIETLCGFDESPDAAFGSQQRQQAAPQAPASSPKSNLELVMTLQDWDSRQLLSPQPVYHLQPLQQSHSQSQTQQHQQQQQQQQLQFQCEFQPQQQQQQTEQQILKRLQDSMQEPTESNIYQLHKAQHSLDELTTALLAELTESLRAQVDLKNKRQGLVSDLNSRAGNSCNSHCQPMPATAEEPSRGTANQQPYNSESINGNSNSNSNSHNLVDEFDALRQP